jgi:hypothetical protein
MAIFDRSALEVCRAAQRGAAVIAMQTRSQCSPYAARRLNLHSSAAGRACTCALQREPARHGASFDLANKLDLT